MQSKSPAVNKLLTATSSIPVWPGRYHDLTLAEAAVLSTEPMQRLRRLRQIGLAYHELPLSEHTRFSHSLGTSYWAMRMMDGVALHDDAVLNKMETRLGPDFSLRLLIRLFALVHDIALLPLGHTMRFQLNLFEEHSFFDQSMRNCLVRVVDQCSHRLAAAASDAAERQALVAAIEAHFELVAAVTRAPRLVEGAAPTALTPEHSTDSIVANIPILTFIYDLVHGVYSADLIDICVRDMFVAGRTWEMPVALLSAGRALCCKPDDTSWPPKARANGHGLREIFRYGVNATKEGSAETAILTDLLHVHQTRFDLAEKAFYSRRKCVADAMLDKCIRRLRDSNVVGLRKLLDPPTLLRMGDDALIDGLIELEKNLESNHRSLAADIRDGALFEEILTVDATRHPGFNEMFGHLQSPSERTALEARVAELLVGLNAEDVVVGILPAQMQSKTPDTLVKWHDERVLPFHDLASEINFPVAATSLADQYQRLRRVVISVSTNQAKSHRVVEASRIALSQRHDLFDRAH